MRWAEASRCRVGNHGLGAALKNKFALAVGALVVLGVFGYFAFGGLGRSLVYFWTPSELLAKGDAAYGTSIRLGGMVEPGSVRWDPESALLRFRLTDEGGVIEVRSRGVPPQMFLEAADRRAPIGAVVEGSLSREDVFQATNLMVKHSEEYRVPDHAEKSPEYYRKLFRDQQERRGS